MLQKWYSQHSTFFVFAICSSQHLMDPSASDPIQSLHLKPWANGPPATPLHGPMAGPQ